MPSDKVVDLFLRDSVHVLELVQGGKFLNIEAVGGDDVWLALEEVLCLNTCDFWDSGEGVGEVDSTALHAVPVVDASLTRLLIYVELQRFVMQ